MPNICESCGCDIKGEPQLWVIDGLHAGVEPTGGEVVDYLDEFPIEGVFTSRIYPEAVRQGVRYFNRREIGGHFSKRVYDAPDESLDTDELAVKRFMHSKCLLPPYWLGIDIHDSSTPKANSLVVGNYTRPESLAVANVLGLENVLIAKDYPFFQVADRFVSVETERDPAHNKLSQAAWWHERLAEIRSMGQSGMHDLGLRTAPNLRYFFQLDLMRVDYNGKPVPAKIKMIERLEDIPVDNEYFAPIDIPPDSHLYNFLPPGAQPRVSYWDDMNHSPERPDILGYRKDGRPRRVCFGAFLLEVTPPYLLDA